MECVGEGVRESERERGGDMGEGGKEAEQNGKSSNPKDAVAAERISIKPTGQTLDLR